MHCAMASVSATLSVSLPGLPVGTVPLPSIGPAGPCGDGGGTVPLPLARAGLCLHAEISGSKSELPIPDTDVSCGHCFHSTNLDLVLRLRRRAGPEAAGGGMAALEAAVMEAESSAACGGRMQNLAMASTIRSGYMADMLRASPVRTECLWLFGPLRCCCTSCGGVGAAAGWSS